MIEYDFVEKVMKTWNPHTPEHEIVGKHKFLNKNLKERTERAMKAKQEKYEAAGLNSEPITETLEALLIEEEARKATIDCHLGNFLEEIKKRSRGENYPHYAHLWTIQDPNGWKKTPWLVEVEPALLGAVRRAFPDEFGPFHTLMTARIISERTFTGKFPEITDEYVQEVRDVEAAWLLGDRNFDNLDFSHMTV